MSTPNPFVPAGSLIAERQRRNRAQFKLAVYAVLAVHAVLVLGLLIQGCKSDSPPGPGTGAAPALPAQVQAQAGQEASPAAAAAPLAEPQPAARSIPPNGRGHLLYVVKSGDTVARIARAHGTTAQALRAANGLKNDRLLVGMKLKLPPPPG
jgi:hypothetical protein